MDRQKHIASVKNESTRNIVIKLEYKNSRITDKDLFIIGADLEVKPMSSAEFYGENNVSNLVNNKTLVFDLFDQDTLHKYFYKKKMPKENCFEVVQKAFLKRTYITDEKILSKTVKLLYKDTNY